MVINMYTTDFDGIEYHEYPIDLSINRRIHVFVYQLIPDIFKNTTTFKGKIFNLKFIFKSFEKLLNKNETVVISRDTELKFIFWLKSIIFKPVSGDNSKHTDRFIKLLDNDSLPYMKFEL